jgi:tetratricopeptide (TPR) repeat protein
MDLMESRLFGDAKANARSRDVGFKQEQYKNALAAYGTSPSSETQATLALAAFDTGKFDEAEKHYAVLVANSPHDLDLLINLAFTLKNLNKLDEAKRTFLRVVEVNPKHNLARSAENEVWMIDPTYKPSWMRR